MFRADESFAYAPAQLPLAPRPIATELFSSWLLRVASANQVSLQELLAGFASRYGPVFANDPIDYGVPEAAVVALARFCRVAPEKIRMLDLRQAGSHPYTLHVSPFSPQCSSAPAVRGAPARLCLLPVMHRRSVSDSRSVGMELVLPRTVYCSRSAPSGRLSVVWRSRSAAIHGCVPWCPVPILCNRLGGGTEVATDVVGCYIQDVQHDYCAALAGVAPSILQNSTSQAFRVFFEEIFHLLTRSLNQSHHKRRAGLFSRQDLLAIIAALVLNAVPSTNQSIRRQQKARGLRLWGVLLSLISENDGATIERSSIRWPAALRQCFLYALCYRKRKRWPHTPYRAATYLGRPVERPELAAEFRLASRD